MRGVSERGYFVLACVCSGRWVDLGSCSRVGACAFRFFLFGGGGWGGGWGGEGGVGGGVRIGPIDPGVVIPEWVIVGHIDKATTSVPLGYRDRLRYKHRDEFQSDKYVSSFISARRR